MNDNKRLEASENIFDIIRILAAIIVVLSHSFRHFLIDKPILLTWLTDGSIGVMILFSLSGFLNMSSYERIKESGETYFQYIKKRLLRLYPLLLFSYFVMTIENAVIYKVDVFSADYVLYLVKRIIYPTGAEYPGGLGNGALWTLPCEILYYFLMPIIYKIIKGCGKNIAAIFIFLAWTINWFDINLISYLPMGIGNPVFFLYEYMIGCWLYEYWYEWKNDLAKPKFVLSAVLLFTVYYFVHVGLGYGVRVGEMHDIVISLIVTNLAIIVGVSFGKIRIKHDITYGTYLIHMLIIGPLTYKGFFGKTWLIPLVLIVSLLFGYLMAVFVDEPLVKWLKDTKNERKITWRKLWKN